MCSSAIYIRIRMNTMRGAFEVRNLHLSSGWTHIGLNYIGPNNGQGIRVYQDGVQAGSDVTRSNTMYSVPSGRVVVGRLYTNLDSEYLGVDVDELLFFNGKLREKEILHLKDTV